MPARVIPWPAAKPEHLQTWWQSLFPQKIEFQLVSRRSPRQLVNPLTR